VEECTYFWGVNTSWGIDTAESKEPLHQEDNQAPQPTQLDEQRCDAALANEAHKNRVKCQYDRSVHPQVFSKGDLVLVYDQDKDPLGAGKFKPMWFGPFIVKEVLKKGAYRLVDFEGNALAEPRNGLYLKK
jgi:hypothetical protein